MIQYASPQLGGASTPSAVRQSLQQLVARTVADQLPAVARRRQALTQVQVLPWHTRVRMALSRCLQYVDRRVWLLRTRGADLAAPDVARSRAAAVNALLAAGADPSSVRAALGG